MGSTLFESLRRRPFLWLNPRPVAGPPALANLFVRPRQLAEAHARWERWQPALARLFPDLRASRGVVESGLLAMPRELTRGRPGRFFVKQDHALPVAGSIKARGALHEVLCVAEDVMAAAGIDFARDPMAPLGDAARGAFAQRTIGVGSTGNLGLAVGIAASALGFRGVVHMSSIAKAWKKERLVRHGVTVKEHEGDFNAAVRAGRDEAAHDPMSYFVDDERSTRLLLGYATAARHLAVQLWEADVVVDAEHPLFVYLPCGVGGAPAGIAFGLKYVYGDAVHCFIAEPCASPSMLARLALGRPVRVYELGLDNRTEADGLAVAEASEPAAAVMGGLVSGAFTVDDGTLLQWVRRMHAAAGLKIEPSAAAGFPGPGWLLDSAAGRAYFRQQGIDGRQAAATHIVWSTGGSFMPDDEHAAYCRQGREGREGAVSAEPLPLC